MRVQPFVLMILASILLALLWFSVGKKNPEGSATNRRLRLALNWVPEPEFGGFYEAERAGFFREQGLEVELIPGGSGQPVLQMLVSGQVDFGVSAADHLLIARSNGADVVGIFAALQTSPQGFMVHSELPINNIGEMLTSPLIENLAMQSGMPFVAFLSRQFTPTVRIVPYMGGVAHFLSSKNNAQQCYVTSEPLQAERAGVHPKTFVIADTGFNPYGSLVATQSKTLKAQPEMVRKFVIALRKGWQAYLDDPGPSNEIMIKLNSSIDTETAAIVAKRQERFVVSEFSKVHGLGAMDPARWLELRDQLATLSIISDAKLDSEAAFVNL